MECLILCTLVFVVGIVMTIGVLRTPSNFKPQGNTVPKIDSTPVRKVYNTRLRKRLDKQGEVKLKKVKEEKSNDEKKDNST